MKKQPILQKILNRSIENESTRPLCTYFTLSHPEIPKKILDKRKKESK